MAQNYWAGEYIDLIKAYFFPDSDSSDSDSYSESDNDGDSYIGWLKFNLRLGFLMAQNVEAGV